MRGLELKVPPVALFLVAGAGMWGVAKLIEAPSFTAGVSWPLAALLAAGGISTGVAGVIAFRRHETTVHPMQPEKATAIVTDGVYRYTRNPMYLGLTLLLCGWGVALGAWPALLWIPAFMLYMTRFQIIPEERALRRGFGAEFDRYQSAVRRWL